MSLPVRGSRGGVGGEVNLSLVMCISSYVFIWSDLNALTTRVGGILLLLLSNYYYYYHYYYYYYYYY